MPYLPTSREYTGAVDMSPSSSSTRNAGGTLRLLVPADPSMSTDEPSIELQGQRWAMKETVFPAPENTPEYTCVSYAWGRGRTTHPFDERQSMSDRTMRVAGTAIRTQRPTALWIDAFCVPFEEPARSVCLSRMGAIYGRASQVVVVLSDSCAALLEQVMSSGQVDAASLLTFERDDWVTRVWTYQ